MFRQLWVFSLLVLLLPEIPCRAVAAELDPPPLEALIHHFQVGTGFTQDSLELYFQTDQEGLEQAQRYLLAAKVLDSLYNARDAEAFAAVFQAAWDHAEGAVFKKILSQTAQSIVGALQLYWEALQLVRDHVVVPSLDERVYEAYSQLRSYGDGTVNRPVEAFRQLAFGTWGNWSGVTYFALREKMLDEYIAAKEYNISLLGNKQLAALQETLDDFWTRRLEARYQHEVFRQRWPTIRAQLEAEGEAVERRIRRGSPEILTKLLPRFPEDLPGNAWLRTDYRNGAPVSVPEVRCKRGCSTGATFIDSPPPHDFTRETVAPRGTVYHEVACHFAVVYVGSPLPSIHQARVSVANRDGLPAKVLKDASGSFPYETVRVFYRGYDVETGCNSQRREKGERKFQKTGTPGLSHEATRFFVRKLLNRIDRLYMEGDIR